MHNKTKISIALNVILSIALVLVGVNGFNDSKDVQKLEEEVKNGNNINSMLEVKISELEIDKMDLEEEKKLAEEALKVANGDIDKLKKLEETIKSNKATIDKLEKEIGTLKSDIAKKNDKIKELEGTQGNDSELNKEIKALKDSIVEKDAKIKQLEEDIYEMSLMGEADYQRWLAKLDQIEYTLNDVKDKINANSGNEEIVNILNEIKVNLENIINHS